MKGISVIIPTHNSALFVADAIQSIIDQEYDSIEIIISDDGSTDRSLEIAESFNEKVKILRKPENCITQGVSSTRNRGIKASTNPFICFLDSDDFYLSGHLKKISYVLENDSELGFAFCRTLYVKQENGKKLFKKYTHQRIFKNDIKNPVVSRSNVVHTNSFIFRREVFDKVGCFNESYSNGEDGDLWMRISEQYAGAFSNHYGSAYRVQHGINQLTNNSAETIRLCFFAIYNNALLRYHELRLNDSNRIFELKHILLHMQYRYNILIYSFRYIYLICQYPISFLRKIPELYYEFLEKKRLTRWYDLQSFL